MTDRRQRQVRFKASDALYGRLLREAAASGTTLSEIVREAVTGAFAARDATKDLVLPDSRGDSKRRRASLPLLELEERLREEIALSNHELALVAAQVRRVEAMIDRLYLGLMLHLPEVPADARRPRSESAEVRHRAWLDAVRRLGEREEIDLPVTEAGPLAGDGAARQR